MAKNYLIGAQLENASGIFQSIEITGTGANQNIAHGLGYTPNRIWWSISSADGNAFTVVPGTHTSTNIVLNFPASVKLYVNAC